MWDLLKIWGPVAVLSAAALSGAYYFVDPAPPSKLTLATGSTGGAYHRYGQQMRDILARDGIEVTLVTSSGSLDNLSLLAKGSRQGDKVQKVDLAFVQSGVGIPEAHPDLVSLASLYYEPVWVFVRGEQPPGRITALAGKRIFPGIVGSGTREIAEEVLIANGIFEADPTGTTFVDMTSSAAAAEALKRGEIDVMFRVSALLGGPFLELMKDPLVKVMSFERADAYVRRFGVLTAVTLPMGTLDLENNLPARDIALITTVANLVAHEDLHPALVDIVLSAANEIFSPGGLFEESEEFPSPDFVEFPLSSDAKRFFESGLRFLNRYLPFWAATIVGRLLVLIIPIVAIIIPLVRVGPPLYRYQIRRRIFRWYRQLRRIEQAMAVANMENDSESRDKIIDQLNMMQDQISGLHVPNAYADQLYQLRLHVGFVRQRLGV